MFQNHMLQLLMMTAMHVPKTISAADIRNEKRKVMESLRPLQKEDVGSQVVRGQYGAGETNHEPVVGYREILPLLTILLLPHVYGSITIFGEEFLSISVQERE